MRYTLVIEEKGQNCETKSLVFLFHDIKNRIARGKLRILRKKSKNYEI